MKDGGDTDCLATCPAPRVQQPVDVGQEVALANTYEKRCTADSRQPAAALQVHSPAGCLGSAVQRFRWCSPSFHLLAYINGLLNSGCWAASKDAAKGCTKPQACSKAKVAVAWCRISCSGQH